MQCRAPTETEPYRPLSDVLFGHAGDVPGRALGKSLRDGFAEVQVSVPTRNGSTVSETAASVMAWLLNDLDPFSSVHLTVAVALNRLRQELARWRPEERADKLDECFRRLRHRPLPHRDPEQHQTGRTRGREGNKHFSPKANQLGDDHGFASRPVIVRDARDRCVFVVTKLQAGHVIGRFPIDDRETLRAYWPELNDEQMNVAKTFALAHAVGESPAGAFPDEAVADDLVKLRDNLAWDLPETETWKSLKADVPPAVEDEQVLRWRVVNP